MFNYFAVLQMRQALSVKCCKRITNEIREIGDGATITDWGWDEGMDFFLSLPPSLPSFLSSLHLEEKIGL